MRMNICYYVVKRDLSHNEIDTIFFTLLHSFSNLYATIIHEYIKIGLSEAIIVNLLFFLPIAILQ